MAESKLSIKSFRYRLGKITFTASCKSSSTILRALLRDHYFDKIYKTKSEHNLIIQRDKPNSPAISENFPCFLLEDDEVLNIQFIKRDEELKTEKCDKDLHLKTPEEFVIFCVNTRGQKRIQHGIMKNKNLKDKVDCVCVVALKGETVEAALRGDGRFEESLFEKDFALVDDEKNITKMKNSVDELKNKVYTVILNSKETMPDCQEMQNDDQSPSTSAAVSGQLSVTLKGQSSGNKEMTNTMKSKSTNKMKILKNIPDPQEIYKILQAQFDSLVQQLKDREKLNDSEVKWFLREEFSEESQCFSQIKTVKKLMALSRSVCCVMYDEQAIGTGFLLFERFILTNAHVITHEGRLLDNLSVRFDFEDHSTKRKKDHALKGKPVAYEYVSTQEHTMDFALMELEASRGKVPPPLLKYYSASPARGGVCIIGHPEYSVKKMDSCLIIERANQEQAVEKCKAENPEHLQIIGEAFFKKKKTLDDSQIEYNSCFFHGSSGSPVFDEHCNVVGMHTGGYVNERVRDSFISIIEYALPLEPILVAILRQTKKTRREHVWESFSKQKNTEPLIQLAEDKDYRPDLKDKCVWDDDEDTEEDRMEVDENNPQENCNTSGLKGCKEEDEDENAEEEEAMATG